MKKPKLSIVGTGRVGTTLGLLFQRQSVFEIKDLVSRSISSSRKAAEIIGAGEPHESLAGLAAADLILIAVPDAEIRYADEALASSGLVGPETTVFHCSGSLTSDDLSRSMLTGASVASIHPVFTFADPVEAADRFCGVPCFIEGDEVARAILTAAFEKIGCRVFPIDPSCKPLYHAASVFASNYLLALLSVSERLLITAGVPPGEALAVTRSLVESTVSNAYNLGIASALTGPIARGDAELVQSHIEELGALDPQLALLYRFLGLETVKIAARKGHPAAHTPERSAALKSVLER